MTDPNANKMKHALEHGEFIVTCEIIPGRGALVAHQVSEFEEAQRLFATGRVHAISVTDNPGGNPALLADAFAADLKAKGITPLVHVTCKDRNRNQMQSQLYSLESRGVENVLIMTGDYPVSGWGGRARPVFDLDPVQTLLMLDQMNEGLVYQGPRGEEKDEPTHFFPGAVVSPFKWTEGETVLQYLKLEKKLYAGARYIISQVGFDARKMEELLLYLRGRGYTVPVIANIFLIGAGAARYMRDGGIPGCYMSEEFLAVLQEEAKAEDKGRAARWLRAAKMVAIARGLGYAGVHIGGLGLTAETLAIILDTADEVQDQWREWAHELHYGKSKGFYYYQPALDAQGTPTGLNAAQESARAEIRTESAVHRSYGLSRFFHYWVLTEGKRGFKLLKLFEGWREKKRGVRHGHWVEHSGKGAIYGCIDCGDCGLEATTYSCPMSQCPKCQRNGACGGSTDGWCEVYPKERICVHFKAYHRLKKHDELYKMDTFITPPNNWDFFETSAWSNYTQQRDNTARRIYLPPREQRGHKEETP
ncbi:MAG: methylenetetrahydrofolate reductase C-terminal domain-containing protein [Coriobacteriales bacterium]|nr:methylenetetrahydrofolate reductase C-terminal domain-containing protein [Coriobacteriales bacterium]